jgi:threonyl-tRNA synthetase
LIFQSRIRSYKELPVRFFELGSVYRQEKAGVLHGLLRVRGFTQDDAHIYCREDQIKDEVKGVIDFVFNMMADFGFDNIAIELSTRPDDFIGSPEAWETATRALEESLKEKKLDYQINEGDGAFYGPKIDFKLKDAIGREWQCATIQCDFSLPERFGLKYVNDQGDECRPIMIHRAILGSIERFIGTLIEHYGGAFPVWLAPTQVVVIPIQEEHNPYAVKIKEELQKEGIRGIIDQRNESLNKRIREGTVKKVPYLLIVGDKEVKDHTVAVRKYGKGDLGALDLDDFVKQLCLEAETKKH